MKFSMKIFRDDDVTLLGRIQFQEISFLLENFQEFTLLNHMKKKNIIFYKNPLQANSEMWENWKIRRKMREKWKKLNFSMRVEENSVRRHFRSVFFKFIQDNVESPME